MCSKEKMMAGKDSRILAEFCNVTGATNEIAKAVLTKNKFILQDSLNEYFETGGISSTGQSTKDVGNSSTSTSQQREQTFTLLTWNIDGLDEKNLILRTLSVTDQIKNKNPDVVFLQEVVNETLCFIKRQCKGYEIYPYHSDDGCEYFCAILLKRTPELKYVSKNATEYPESMMGRYLLRVDIIYGGQPITLMTTHLESTQPAKCERMNQLEFCFNEVSSVGEKAHVIFGGDLNLRDTEAREIDVPNGIKDAWIETGCKRDTKFTWDMSLNDNLTMQGTWKPKIRFDRLYFKSAANQQMKPTVFELIGKDRLMSCDRFASDHWGILCKFTIGK